MSNARRDMLIGNYIGGGRTVKSAFNKEKWKPLAQELPAKISHYCCYDMKKSPLRKMQTKLKAKPIVGTRAEESRVRTQAWVRTGCNSFGDKAESKPMSFWTHQDVLEYIVKHGLKLPSVYGDIVSVDDEGHEYPPMLCDPVNLKTTGADRTGCVFCAFGMHLEKGESRYERLAKTHPQLYEYAIGGGEWADNPDYDPTAPEYDGEWKNWNPKQIWIPSVKGLGFGKLFDMANDIMGDKLWRY